MSIATAAPLAALLGLQIHELTGIQTIVQVCHWWLRGGWREAGRMDGSRDLGSWLPTDTFKRSERKKVSKLKEGFKGVKLQTYSSHQSDHCSPSAHHRISQQAGMSYNPDMVCCQLGSFAQGCSSCLLQECGHVHTCMSDLLGWRGTGADSCHCFLCTGWNLSYRSFWTLMVKRWRGGSLGQPATVGSVFLPAWLDLLKDFMVTTCVPTSNHIFFCCCSLYQTLVASEERY